MLPNWVEKFKTPGKNISCINGNYYLYEVSSVWDKEKKKARKITKKYLGRITEDGLTPPKEKVEKIKTPITIKEYGTASVLNDLGNDIYNRLKKFFPLQADMLYILALIRLSEHCPFKRIEQIYNHSYLSEMFKGLKLSGKSISEFMKDFGDNREQIVAFMKSFTSANEYILFDGTSIISNSKKMDINRLGYNAHRQYDPQINLMYAFGHESKTPVYYRIVAGNIRDITAFGLCVDELKLKDTVIIADKGFASEDNFKMLEHKKLKYIVPLRRSSNEVDYSPLKLGCKEKLVGYFNFNKRPIWYYICNDILIYVDNDLKNEEEKDYLLRIEKGLEGFSLENFMKKQFSFGTIALKTNVEKTPEEIYCTYKERKEIEQTFDFLKNLFEQDTTYMQNEKSLETWAFINHITLLIHYKLYVMLKNAKLLSKFSVADFLQHLKYIYKIKVDTQWLTSEISTKTKNLLSSIDFHIT